jgi:formamidopyrimidine-DNA glycosylase
MPELPEVENYRRDLRDLLLDRQITGVEVDWPNQIGAPSVRELVQRLPGQRITDIHRRGKYLVFTLSGGDSLLIHLKMSGRLMIEPVSAPPDPHAHVVFSLGDGEELRFRDTRKFGRVYLVADPEQVVGKLGPEPLEPDFTPERLDAMLANRRGRLKPLLLNQQFLAGIGNIYADESLHAARLHPLRTADTLSQGEINRLQAAIRFTLHRAIEHRGTSFSWVYRDAYGEPGEFQALLQVYNREGEPCYRCGTPIERIVVGQRSTYFCPQCQRRKGVASDE